MNKKILLNHGRGIPPKKKIDDKTLIKIILVYSAMKISANAPALYSVLKPETSSDSPSAKSKGVRFVSARAVANQIKQEGRIMSLIHEDW